MVERRVTSHEGKQGHGDVGLFWKNRSLLMEYQTSQHQSAREKTNCYVRLSRISSRQAKGFEKEKKNIQEFTPGRNAMQWPCGLLLFFKLKNTYSMIMYL